MTPSVPFVYFDHNATTPVCREVQEALPLLAQSWGNPSSIHWGGRQPKNILRDARKAVAEAIGAGPLEIVFTSGGSEANNTVLKGIFQSTKTRTHFMCSAVEHPSVMKAMLHLRDLGAQVDFIPVNRKGQIDLDFYKTHLSERTALVSVMLANNETGTLFPVKEMAELAHQKGALFHTDAVQAFGKMPLSMRELNVDFASFSAHKFYSVKGTGFIYSRKGSQFVPLIHGGGQERHRRGGTENVLGIGCLGVVAQRINQVAEKAQHLSKMRDEMEKRILSEISDVTITAGESPRLANTSSLVLKGVDGETMLMALDLKGYAVSTGAACSSGNPEPSPVLLAMGLSRAEAQNSLRISLGWETTPEQIEGFIEALKVVVQRLRSLQNEEGESDHV